MLLLLLSKIKLLLLFSLIQNTFSAITHVFVETTMKYLFVILSIVIYFVNVSCASVTSYVPSNISKTLGDTFLRSNVETTRNNINQININKSSKEKRRVQEELRKRRNVKYSDVIYFPGETNAKTTTVPATVRLRNRIIITQSSCSKGYKRIGGWCVPSEGDGDDDYD